MQIYTEVVLAATLLNILVALLVRKLQGTNPYHINTSEINAYKEKIHSFKYLRICFGILVLTNSVLVAEDYTLRGVLVYVIYYVPLVSWFHFFYKSRFKLAFVLGLFSSCMAMVNALFFKPHPFLWLYAISFSSFTAYLSAYFEYCVVKN